MELKIIFGSFTLAILLLEYIFEVMEYHIYLIVTTKIR